MSAPAEAGGAEPGDAAARDWPPGPRRLAPPREEVHVWRAELDGGGWPELAALPAPERQRAARIARAEGAARWVAARWALRSVLSRYLGEDPAAIEISPDANGKPRLANDAGLFFNLSHSGSLALIAVSAICEVGVDVEATGRARDFAALARRALGDAAAAAVLAAAPARRAAVFYAEWTRHEAAVKCLGGGLFGSPPDRLPIATVALDAGPDHMAALAVAAPQVPPVRVYSARFGQ